MNLVETAAHGAEVAIQDNATTPAYNALLGVFNGPNGGGTTPRPIEAFHHGSTVVKKKASVVDQTPVTFSMYYDSTDMYHQQLRDASLNKTVEAFQITYTDTGAEISTFTAVVAFDRSADPGDWNIVQVTLTPFTAFVYT